MSTQKQPKPTKKPETTEIAIELTQEELGKASGGFASVEGEASRKDHTGRQLFSRLSWSS